MLKILSIVALVLIATIGNATAEGFVCITSGNGCENSDPPIGGGFFIIREEGG